MVKPYYEHGGITIYHGDCQEVLPILAAGAMRVALGETYGDSLRLSCVDTTGTTGTSGSAQGHPASNVFDLLLTDPPYGIGADKAQAARANKQYGRALAPSRDYGTSVWDSAPPQRWLLDCARSMATWQIIFGGNYFELPPSRCWLVWDKVTGDNDYADCELAWTNLDKPVRKRTFQWKGMLTEPGFHKEYRWHPTQKPVPIIRWAISQVPSVRTVIDPWMGSGTTLRAAKDAGLYAIGIEINERYCEIAANRLSQEVLPLEFAGA